jgi:hypothetical protein
MEHEKELGSFETWFVVRGAQLLLYLIWFGVVPPLVRVRGVELLDLFVLLVLVQVTLAVDSLAYGHADRHGIVFRRYVKRNLLPWERVAEVEWGAARLTVVPKQRTYLRPSITFHLNPSPLMLIRQTFRDEVPEVVQWLLEEVQPQYPGALGIRRHQAIKSLAQQWREKRVDWWGVFAVVVGALLFIFVVVAAMLQRLALKGDP